MPWIINSELAHADSRSVDKQTGMLLQASYTLKR